MNNYAENMNIIEALKKKRNGTFFKVKWQTDLNKKVKKQAREDGLVIIKEVESVVRKGIRYKEVKGVDFKGKGLSWGEFVEGSDGTLIKGNNGKIYVKLYTCTNKPKVKYKMGDVEISKEALQDMEIMQNGYWKEREKPIIMTIPIENILEIG